MTSRRLLLQKVAFLVVVLLVLTLVTRGDLLIQLLRRRQVQPKVVRRHHMAIFIQLRDEDRSVGVISNRGGTLDEISSCRCQLGIGF